MLHDVRRTSQSKGGLLCGGHAYLSVRVSVTQYRRLNLSTDSSMRYGTLSLNVSGHIQFFTITTHNKSTLLRAINGWTGRKKATRNCKERRLYDRPGAAATFLTPTREALGSNLGRETGLLWFSQYFRANAWRAPRLRHDSFLPDSFQFIMHLSSYHLTPYSLATDRAVK
jgi:hypothetical protein